MIYPWIIDARAEDYLSVLSMVVGFDTGAEDYLSVLSIWSWDSSTELQSINRTVFCDNAAHVLRSMLLRSSPANMRFDQSAISATIQAI